METELPVQKSPLLMDTGLYEMLNRYLDTQPYGSIKPVLEGIKPMPQPAEDGSEPKMLYSMTREATLHLLNKVMGNENMVKTYMFIRQGFERLVAADAAAPAPAPEPTKTKKIVEHPVESTDDDNVNDA